ncbi:hypothetical protein F3Y22_tig00110478pilonHSYRG00181 [Hibiscus syriacus]|uniref:Uncharacterized protein n=1 Tax=Hibiscus syriacus TaxID=106335 RepID=A0A6A3AJP9_HIBSY|nr:hypothetical protein F3Y22_tig00110478pilonHSYRG00181 [Hibiscus syriacus]
MSDVVPTSFLNMSSSLKQLGVFACKLQGEFPSEIFQLGYLEYLDLGSIPASLGNLTESPLQVLEPTIVQPHTPYFFTSWLFTLPFLDHSHNRNNFRGNVPACVGNSSFFISTINLKKNNVSGKIPDFYVHGYRLNVLSLNDNQLEGSLAFNFLPKSACSQGCKNLKNMVFRSYIEGGIIPNSIGELWAIQVLNLSCNGFSGHIPLLNFSHNNLMGLIPNGKQFNTFEKIPTWETWGYVASPDKEMRQWPGPEPPSPKSKKDGGGSAVSFFWKLVLMGYASGVVVGISTAYIVFTAGRPRCLEIRHSFSYQLSYIVVGTEAGGRCTVACSWKDLARKSLFSGFNFSVNDLKIGYVCGTMLSKLKPREADEQESSPDNCCQGA